MNVRDLIAALQGMPQDFTVGIDVGGEQYPIERITQQRAYDIGLPCGPSAVELARQVGPTGRDGIPLALIVAQQS